MKRIWSVCALLGMLMIAQAQIISTSPYSAFGYGDNRMTYGAATYGMADLSTAYMSPFGTESNFMNPAANMNLRLTNFTFEGSMDITNFQSNDESFTRTANYISRISLGFPMGPKWRAGIGFQPFSALGYNVAAYNYNSVPQTVTRYQGDGGLNTFHAMTSYNFNKNLALGLRANYIFGSLNKSELGIEDGAQLYASYATQNDISGFALTGGIAYNKEVKENHFLTLGATYSLGSNIKATQDYLVSTYQIYPTTYEPFNIDTLQYVTSNRKVRIPEALSVGVSYGKEYKWNIGAQVDWEKNSAFILVNDLTNNTNNRFRTAVGGYYIPQFNSFRSYFARATYRAGVYYEKTPIEINGQDINDMGITLGVGLPVGKANDPSEINLGVQLGQRGTKDAGLVKENYANLKLSFTLNDAWFQRRKYD